MEATDFIDIFENEANIEEEIKEELKKSKSTYWEFVFANATADAHKLFKSQKNKMYIEFFEETLRKILRYRNLAKEE